MRLWEITLGSGKSHSGLGPWLIPGRGGAWHPGPCPQTFSHQGKGTQQAIPTRSPAAQYSNSWGRWEGPGIQRKEWSGQRKNRRNCEKELWMKCEKQRHQGEENSSKLKRENQPFQPIHTWCWRTRARGAAPQAPRTLPEGWPMARVPSLSAPSRDSPAGPKASDRAFIHSFIPLPYPVPSTGQLA